MNNRGNIPFSTIAEKLKETEKGIAESNQVSSSSSAVTTEPLLFVNGRLDRKNIAYTAKNLPLLTELNEEIKIYCKGIDVAILNYLIHKGLESIKQQKNFTSVEYSEIEQKYNSLDKKNIS